MAADKPFERIGLVTGAGRGIGAAAALALARRGIAPVLAVRDTEAARPLADEVRALGAPVRVVACDVADAASVQAAVARTLDDCGRLDVVVNNAGVVEPIGRVGDTDPGQWARAVAVNLTGVYFVVHAALPALLERRGVIINVSTGAAYRPREGWSAYCSSKAGLAMLTRCLAHEYAESDLAVYGLQPGLVDTGMQAQIRASGLNPVSRLPRSELGSAQPPAELIAWVADERPSDLIGQDLSVRDAQLMGRAGLA